MEYVTDSLHPKATERNWVRCQIAEENYINDGIFSHHLSGENMETSVIIPKEEYDELIKKVSLFDKYVETEELTEEELQQIRKALKGPFLTKAEFLKRHPELS